MIHFSSKPSVVSHFCLSGHSFEYTTKSSLFWYRIYFVIVTSVFSSSSNNITYDSNSQSSLSVSGFILVVTKIKSVIEKFHLIIGVKHLFL